MATALYAAAALALTWPLAAGLARDIPWDLGDSVLNAWILQWGADHWLRFLGGDLGAFRGYFNANIFYPEPLTLAYSEHLTAQVLQILPVYALTGNIVLSYNLLFLSTFVLSGLGTFLLVRELTGQRARRVRGGPALRVRALSHRAVLAPAGAVVAVDAVRAVRLPALLRHAPRLAAGRRGSRARAAELVVRLLPAVFRAVRRRVRHLRDCGPRAVEGPDDVGVAWRGGRAGTRRHGAAAHALPRTAGARVRRPPLRGGHALLSRCLQLSHRPRRPVVLGRHRSRVPQAGGGSVSVGDPGAAGAGRASRRTPA